MTPDAQGAAVFATGALCGERGDRRSGLPKWVRHNPKYLTDGSGYRERGLGIECHLPVVSFVIGMIGLPGSGKTSLAWDLANSVGGAMRVNDDSMKTYLWGSLERAGFHPDGAEKHSTAVAAVLANAQRFLLRDCPTALIADWNQESHSKRVAVRDMAAKCGTDRVVHIWLQGPIGLTAARSAHRAQNEHGRLDIPRFGHVEALDRAARTLKRTEGPLDGEDVIVLDAAASRKDKLETVLSGLHRRGWTETVAG